MNAQADSCSAVVQKALCFKSDVADEDYSSEAEQLQLLVVVEIRQRYLADVQLICLPEMLQ
jgi:hypothetical protein